MKRHSDRFKLANDNYKRAQDARNSSNNHYVDKFSRILTFGIHKGKPICAVPYEYLDYTRKVMHNMFWVQMFSDELERRHRLASSLNDGVMQNAGKSAFNY